MSVERYRDARDMPPTPRVSGPALAERIRSLWRRSRLLAPDMKWPRGVERFRTIEEAQAARAAARGQRR